MTKEKKKIIPLLGIIVWLILMIHILLMINKMLMIGIGIPQQPQNYHKVIINGVADECKFINKANCGESLSGCKSNKIYECVVNLVIE